MKTFLASWLAEAPAHFARELSGQAKLVPSEQLPAQASVMGLAVVVRGQACGRFTIAVEREALHRLFVEARVTEAEPDVQRDAELWRGLVQQLSEAAARAFGGIEISSIEDASWALGLPAAAYEIQLGNEKARVAFLDEVRVQAEPLVGETQTSTKDKESDARFSQVGLDLLLDVELEASLRFGSSEMPLNDVLELGPGDVVALDRHVADPVDLLVGDKIVARGEVILINGSFGLRVLEVAEPRKRLESIRCLF